MILSFGDLLPITPDKQGKQCLINQATTGHIAIFIFVVRRFIAANASINRENTV